MTCSIGAQINTENFSIIELLCIDCPCIDQKLEDIII